MNRVWPLPDASWTMPLTRDAGLGLDRHHVAPVAERDDRLLEGAAELRADERVEPPPQPVVGDPDGGPQATEPGRGRVEQLAGRIEAAGQGRAQGRQGVELAPEVAQQRPALVGERRRQPRGRIERVGDLEELGRLQPSATRGPLDRRADVAGRSDPDARPLLDERPRLVGLVERAGDDDRVIGRLERLGQPARRPERGGRREPCPDGRELEQHERALVHGLPAGQRVRVGPDSDRWPRSTKRHGSAAHGSPA